MRCQLAGTVTGGIAGGGDEHTFIDNGLVAVADLGGVVPGQNLDVALVCRIAVVEQTGHGTCVTSDTSSYAGRGIKQVLFSGGKLSDTSPMTPHGMEGARHTGSRPRRCSGIRQSA